MGNADAEALAEAAWNVGSDEGAWLTGLAVAVGRYRDTRLLRGETVDEMRRVQNAPLDGDQGLVWYWSDIRGRRVLGHNGAYRGASTDMNFDPTTGIGVIVLTNGEAYFNEDQGASDALSAIEARLFDEAPRL